MNGYLGPEQVFDAEEFFRARRDAELGRWRSPLHPDYVVYRIGYDALVVGERVGLSQKFARGDVDDAENRVPAQVAFEYFEAHPERKPWEDAQYGEVWAVTHTGGQTDLCRVTSYGRFEQVSGTDVLVRMPLAHPSITAARKVWPEDAS